MKKLYISCLFAFVSAFNLTANSAEVSQSQIDSLSMRIEMLESSYSQIDSLSMQIQLLNEKVDDLNHQLLYRKMYYEIESIINDMKILSNDIDNHDAMVMIFKAHNHFKKKAKELFRDSYRVKKDAADIIEKHLTSWKTRFDLYDTINYFTDDEKEILENCYLCALATKFVLTNSLDSYSSSVN